MTILGIESDKFILADVLTALDQLLVVIFEVDHVILCYYVTNLYELAVDMFSRWAVLSHYFCVVNLIMMH